MFYYRLKPSTIPGAGVGVFATNDIPQGTMLKDLFGADDVIRFSKEEFAALELPDEIKDNFAVQYETECFLPKAINRMSVGWYLNDSPEPNLGHDSSYNYFALRDIAAGEELLIKYDDL
jgi:SET domain-containing protein